MIIAFATPNAGTLSFGDFLPVLIAMGLISLLIVGERRKIRRRQAQRRPVRKVCRERIPQQVKSVVWRRDDGACVRCGSTDRLEFGHIIPWSKGGSDTANNLQILCLPCNRREGNRI